MTNELLARIGILENQQKEFIEYLENEINRFKDLCLGDLIILYEEILSKYKSIIGVKDENNKQ